MKLVQIVDSIQYVKTNCWQHQLLKHLKEKCNEHVLLELSELKKNEKIQDADVVISTLKLRSLSRSREMLKACLSDRKIFIYEQDPWENFIDTGSCHGTYEWLNENLNIGSFIITSKWWTDYVVSLGLPAQFAPMWVNSSLCDEGIEWSSRPIDIGFMGTLHPHRKKTIDKLLQMGIKVNVFPSEDYNIFLQKLSQMQFFFHEEASSIWTIKGQRISQNALWAKEIEIACRGCCALRQYESEALAYNATKIPNILTFENLEEIPEIIKKTLNDQMSNTKSRQGVDFIRKTTGWFDPNDL